MKKPLILLLLLAITFSCKKEKPPKQKTIVKKETMIENSSKHLQKKVLEKLEKNPNRKEFSENILPLISKLEKENGNKYKMISIIASKLVKEPNNHAYNIGVKNLKNELIKIN